MNIFLIVSALITAISSYCYEGLSNEVALFAKNNDDFATQNEILNSQIKDMEGVRKKYESLLEDFQGDETMLKDLVDLLHRVVLMKNVETVFQAFIEADTNRCGAIGPKEAEVFFSNAWQVLEYASGDFTGAAKTSASSQHPVFPLRTLHHEAVNRVMKPGQSLPELTTDDVKLLAFAVGLSGDPGRPFASRALLWMVLFSFNPDAYADQLTESLIQCVVGTTFQDAREEAMRKRVRDIRNAHAAAFKFSSEPRCIELVNSILSDAGLGRQQSRRSSSQTPRSHR